MDRKPFQKRFDALKNEYEQNRKATHQKIAEYVNPMRGNFNIDQPNKGSHINYQTLLDDTPQRSASYSASGIFSNLSSPSRPWFRIGLNDKSLMQIETVKQWINTVQEILMDIFTKSNFYNSMHTLYEEIITFGTGAAIMLPDHEDVIRMRVFTAGEYYLGIGPDCRVNTFAREFMMTVDQLVKEFGIDNVSESTKALYNNNNVDQWKKVFHLIEPNDSRIPNKQDFKNMPYRSVYWEEGAEQDNFLRIGGYKIFPIICPRWDVTTTSDIYGDGPGRRSLGMSQTLQKMTEDMLRGLDKLVDPPIVASDTIEFVNLLPGGITRASQSEKPSVYPLLQVNIPLDQLRANIQEIQRSINETFYVQLFLMIQQADRPNMTAREVAERHEEKLLMLGPVVERLETEGLDKSIESAFHYAVEAGIIPDPPQEIQGVELNIEYISMLAQAQKMVGTASIEQTFAFAGNLYAAFPEILDKLDPDEAIDQYSEMLGTPPKVVRSDDDVKKIREARAQQQQQAQQMQNNMATIQGAKVLSDTPVGAGQQNALTALLQGANGGQQ